MRLLKPLAIALLVLSHSAVADEKPVISGVFHAQEVPGSPALKASGMAWWNGRLVIADYGEHQMLGFTPPDRFEPIRKLTNPVGLAVDGKDRLVVTEKLKDVIYRVGRIDREGKDETLASDKAEIKGSQPGVGAPQLVAVHPNGTIYWSNFPDSGTRYLLPGEKEVGIAKPFILHTFGIGVSPDGKWLYVATKVPDPDRRGVWRFPLDETGRPGVGELFIQISKFTTTHLKDLPAAKDSRDSLLGWVGRLQGLAVDKDGCIYVGGAESHNSGAAVAVFTPDGKTLTAMIVDVPRNISGLALGGDDGRTLFISGAGEYKLHQVKLNAPAPPVTTPATRP